MALATNSTPGSIVLAGDLTGTATTPELRVTGVTPGSYTSTNIVVDSKGRVVNATSADLSSSVLAGDVTGSLAASVLSDTPVTPGVYTQANITVDSKGRTTAASTGSLTLAGDVTGSPSATLLSNTAVTPGSYTTSNLTIDGKGRVTAAASGSLTTTLTGDVTGTVSATVLSNTSVTPGSYTAANLTVDGKGRITAASNGSLSTTLSGDVTGTTSATVLSNTTVTPGSYTAANITIDSKGRVTAASSTTPLTDASTSVKGLVQITSNTGLSVSSGVLSGTLASGTSTYGMVKYAGGGLSISSGVVDINTAVVPRLSAINVWNAAIKYTMPAATATLAPAGTGNNWFSIRPDTSIAYPTSASVGQQFTFVYQGDTIVRDATTPQTMVYGTNWVSWTGAGVKYSSNGTSWSTASIPNWSGGYTIYLSRAVAWSGTRYVILGRYNNTVDWLGAAVHSTNGSSWTAVSVPTDADVWMGAAWNGTTFCGVGADYFPAGTAYLVTSGSGTTWSQGTCPIPLVPNQTGGITSNGTAFCIWNHLGTVAMSTDGTNWSAANTPAQFHQVAGGNGFLFAGSASGVYKSSDGVTWTLLSGSPTNMSPMWDGTTWVGVNDVGGIYTSATGVTWTLVGFSRGVGLVGANSGTWLFSGPYGIHQYSSSTPTFASGYKFSNSRPTNSNYTVTGIVAGSSVLCTYS